MAEMHIVAYHGKHVSYVFLDHHDKQTTIITPSVEEFIASLLIKINDLIDSAVFVG